MATVVVSDALANRPGNGGGAWARLSWVLGLERLGCDVYFFEQIPWNCCVDRHGNAAFEGSVNLAFFQRVTQQFGLAERSALICENGERIHGMTLSGILDLAQRADLLVNLGGHLTLPPILDRFRRKAFIDIDPGFTQFWHADGTNGFQIGGHDYYFTIGENIGTPACSIPTCGIRWRPIRQPVLLEHWPVVPNATRPLRFTTVANWRGPFGPIQHGGKTLGLKVHEFRKVIDLPRRAPAQFEIALNIHPADVKDLHALKEHGWHIVGPQQVACDPDSFREYIQKSSAEFSVAQGVYVETNSGWFSDRTIRYLASGKPVLVQDTGFRNTLPVGEGLVAFRTLEEAVSGAEDIARNYDRHCLAARALAEKFFDSDRVLGQMLDEVGVAL